jgi:PAS domain S-box-containing protein
MTENIQLPERHGRVSGLIRKTGEALPYGADMASTWVGAVSTFVHITAHKSARISKAISRDLSDRAGVVTLEWKEIVKAIAAHAAAAVDNIRVLRAPQIEVERRRQAELAAQRLAAIVESSDDAIIAKNLDGIITNWNRGAQRLLGYTAEEVIGKPNTMLIPPDRLDEESAILARICNCERVNHYETIRRHKDGSLVEISLTVSPIKNSEGKIVGVSKIARDITDRRRAQEQQRLLLKEMNHRIKNVFAISSSLVTLSARSADTPEHLASAVRERLGALARAHALTLSKPSDETIGTEQPTTLHALIGTIVSPYEDKARARFAVNGPDIRLAGGVVTALALLLHEFATNAAKHGALSMPGGHVDIECSNDNDLFVLIWKERGGPRLNLRPDSEGFGSLLAHATVKGQLGGEISRDWKPEGLTIWLSVPRERLMD